MATANYMAGRKKYSRPQAMLWSENSGTLVDGKYVPIGLEVGANPGAETDESLFNNFLILSDDNRSEIEIFNTRIEQRKRMINGRMRSFFIADKLTISLSWDMLPSRSFELFPDFGSDGKSKFTENRSSEYTTDGGAGGVDILEWYENHQGSFWVYLAYDKHSIFGNGDEAYSHLPEYNQLVEMFFSDFKYSIVKRGGTTHDFWNISVTLEEV